MACSTESMLQPCFPLRSKFMSPSTRGRSDDLRRAMLLEEELVQQGVDAEQAVAREAHFGSRHAQERLFRQMAELRGKTLRDVDAELLLEIAERHAAELHL